MTASWKRRSLESLTRPRRTTFYKLWSPFLRLVARICCMQLSKFQISDKTVPFKYKNTKVWSQLQQATAYLMKSSKMMLQRSQFLQIRDVRLQILPNSRKRQMNNSQINWRQVLSRILWTFRYKSKAMLVIVSGNLTFTHRKKWMIRQCFPWLNTTQNSRKVSNRP